MRSLVVLLLVALLVALGPLLLHRGLPHGSATGTELVALRGFLQGLEEGEAYPRWIADANRAMGAPLFLFQPPLAYYAGAVVDLFMPGALETYRFTLVLAFFLAGLGFHRVARERVAEPVATMGALLYALSPVVVAQIYDRGSLPELAALVLLPLVYGAIERHGRALSRRSAVAVCFACAALLLAEPGTAYLGGLVLGPLVLARLPSAVRRGRFFGLILPYLVSIPLAAIYLVPLYTEEGGLVRGRPAAVTGFDGGHAGYLLWVALAGAWLLLATWRRAAEGEERRLPGEAAGLLAISLACWGLQHSGLAQLAGRWPLTAYQAMTGILGAMIAVHVAAGTARGAWAWRRPGAILVVGVAAMPALAVSGRTTYARPFDLDPVRVHHPALHDAILPDCYPAGAPPVELLRAIPSPPGRAWCLGADAEIQVKQWLGHRRTLQIRAQSPTQVLFRSFPFAGWTASLDGKPVELVGSGIYRAVAVAVPAGVHRVTVTFGTNQWRRIGGYVSLLVFMILLSMRFRREPEAVEESETTRSLWGLAVVLCVWGCSFATLQGADLFFHLATGREILESGSPVLAETWSYAARGGAWCSFEWLSGVLLHQMSRVGGLSSLVWWQWAVTIAAFFVMFVTLLRAKRPAGPAAVAVVLGAVIGGPFFEARPHIQGLLLTAVLIHALMRGAIGSWLLPALFLLWANLHPSVIFGLGVVGLFGVCEVFCAVRDGQREEARALFGRYLMGGLLCGLATLVNPQGVNILTFPLRYGFDASSPFRLLTEWLPHGEPAPIASHHFPWLAAAFSLTVLWRLLQDDEEIRGKDLALIGLGCVTMIMAFRARRFIPLFGLCQAPVLAVGLAAAGRAFLPRRAPLIAPAAACILGIAWLLPYPRSGTAFPYLINLHYFPVEMVDFIQANGIRGKVFAAYGWGGYLHYRTDGALRTFVDGRADMAFDRETFITYLRIDEGQPGAEALLLGSGAEYVLWPRTREAFVSRLLASGRWRLLYVDPVSKLLVRSDVSLPSSMVPAPASPYQLYSNGLELARQGRIVDAWRRLSEAVAVLPTLQAAEVELAALHLEASFAEAWAIFEASQRKFPHRASRVEFLERVRKARRLGAAVPGD